MHRGLAMTPTNCPPSPCSSLHIFPLFLPQLAPGSLSDLTILLTVQRALSWFSLGRRKLIDSSVCFPYDSIPPVNVFNSSAFCVELQHILSLSSLQQLHNSYWLFQELWVDSVKRETNWSIVMSTPPTIVFIWAINVFDSSAFFVELQHILIQTSLQQLLLHSSSLFAVFIANNAQSSLNNALSTSPPLPCLRLSTASFFASLPCLLCVWIKIAQYSSLATTIAIDFLKQTKTSPKTRCNQQLQRYLLQWKQRKVGGDEENTGQLC